MTLGIDVSTLFAEMVKASSIDDVVSKKMIYHYLTANSKDNQQMVIMTINTFLRDCKSHNGKVRGLALRSLCTLKFDGVAQYTQGAISEGLDDIDPYVKKTAIIGCIKMYKNSKKEFKQTKFIEKLRNLIKDPDSNVVINTIQALNEILENKGGLEVDSKLVIYLLNRIKDFNEWGQSVVLELVSGFKPQDRNLNFDIMNLLES